VSLQVTAGSDVLAPFRLVIDPAIPEVFRTTAGNAVMINQDGTINSQSNPAKSGSIVAIWATGVGLPLPGADGQETIVPQQLCNCEIFADFIRNASTDDANLRRSDVPSPYEPVVYAGAAPGTVTGLVQINFQVTDGTK
jgi:hypothetical protein